MYTLTKNMTKEAFQTLMANQVIQNNAILEYDDKSQEAMATLFTGEEVASKVLERMGFEG